ncbi:type I methionyl aminopeptidase [Pontibacter sp. BT310]|uniref:Methionine aminopeptidase n=1 Tax=Pontibacter populi TaxID=890055 RepID=A0ABS6X8S0_9BACT|nr:MULTISPECIES: type I methionyl aminopeptidase [Pontibacter]MBJ6117206.1 type I methionyl aminopeptidase [Pontibacter sp. BT310]MBR0569631.1 type I methionyl aminopeptidase [Microvirga sp. STS03]MBW3364059.1 type I methionyl aminopeptidase [Pontibacter populi]
MIFYKTEEEIELIRQGALILGKAHGEIASLIKEGITTAELDKRAEEFIKDHGAQPSFLNYNGFPYSLCISPNAVVVHGFPGKHQLRDGDIISVDGGVYYKGFHSDSAYTHAVGNVSEEVKKLLEVTKKSLQKGIEKAIVGNRMGDISHAVQQHAEANGFSVVRELVGHGVGRNLHEAPEVPNYGKKGQGVKLQEGLVLAIEPMINLGTRNVVQEEDGWTIRTRDKKPSAHFEHTVVVRKGKAEVLTTFDYIEKAKNL